jgi:hypothetical protein
MQVIQRTDEEKEVKSDSISITPSEMCSSFRTSISQQSLTKICAPNTARFDFLLHSKTTTNIGLKFTLLEKDIVV